MRQRIPASLSIPLLKISEHLDLPPVATYAATCLWNYRLLFPDEPRDLSNLATLCTFTGSLDEQWFYLISTAIEAHGAPTLAPMLKAISAARADLRSGSADNAAFVTDCLQHFAMVVSELGDLLQEMYQNCHPHAFYHGFRPYLAGSSNMGEAGLPNGIIYEDGSGTEEYRQYGGGSNAQSSLIQFFDIVLGIEHRPTGEHPPTEHGRSRQHTHVSPDSATDDKDAEGPRRRHNFIMEMRKYMPGQHRRFLEHVASVANIHEYVSVHQNNSELCAAYNACLAMVRSLRQKHIQMVTRYIVVKSRESRDQHKSLSSRPEPIINLAAASSTQKKLRGTGGTALIEFLKQARDETGDPAIGAWANRMLNLSPAMRERTRRKSAAAAPKKDVETSMVGLAGSWSLEETEGGLCHW
jgi:indoleamine 2,3-dioxygenase